MSNLIATTAAIISVGGPAGPVFLLVFPEKSKRYFLFISALCSFNSVDGFINMADLSSCDGDKIPAKKPKDNLSEKVKSGERFRPRQATRSCYRRAIFSAAIAFPILSVNCHLHGKRSINPIYFSNK